MTALIALFCLVGGVASLMVAFAYALGGRDARRKRENGE